MSRSTHESVRPSKLIEGHRRRGGLETRSPRCYVPTARRHFSVFTLAFLFLFVSISFLWDRGCSKMSMYRYLLYIGLSKATVEHNVKDHVSGTILLREM